MEQGWALRRLSVVVCLVVLVAVPRSALGFTQGVTAAGKVLPLGHEWITRQAALEVIGCKCSYQDDADPRKEWTAEERASIAPFTGAAAAEADRIRNGVRSLRRDGGRYWAIYDRVHDAIIGERWVDIAGVNVALSHFFDQWDCMDLVAQQPADVQYDHFMRRFDDRGGQGGVNAATWSRERFIQYFVDAAMAADGNLTVWDGGASSEEFVVDRHYFLFGRALHLFEDSFSSEHTVRTADDKYRKVRQVKSYLCALGSQQHSHLSPALISNAFYETGDVIWKTAETGDYRVSNMKPEALAAIEGTKEVWAAFIRTMATPRAQRREIARQEAGTVADHWLAFDGKEMREWYVTHPDQPTYIGQDSLDQQKQCTDALPGNGAKKTQAELNKDLEQGRRVCLYNMVPSWGLQQDVDRALHLAYHWQWRGVSFEDPPDTWNVAQNDDVQIVKVKLVNRGNGVAMYRKEEKVYNDPAGHGKPGTTEVELAIALRTSQPLDQPVTFNIAGKKDWYLGHADGDAGWHRVWIYDSSGGLTFKFERRKDGYYNIKNVGDGTYLYVHTDGNPYLNSSGDPTAASAQWRVDGLPEPYPADADYLVEIDKAPIMVQDGKLVLNAPGMFGAKVHATRQPNGAYRLRIDQSHIRYDAATGTLFLGAAPGSDFELEPGPFARTYTIRADRGRYWAAGAPGDLITVQGDASCEPGPGDPCNPVISDNNTPLPPECRDRKPVQCKPPQAFDFDRSW